MTTNIILGKRISALREEQNLSQIEFAKILNISNTTLSQYETGKRTPSDDIKIKIANHFDVSIDYLLGRSDIKNPYSTINCIQYKKDLINDDILFSLKDFREFLLNKTDG